MADARARRNCKHANLADLGTYLAGGGLLRPDPVRLALFRAALEKRNRGQKRDPDRLLVFQHRRRADHTLVYAFHLGKVGLPFLVAQLGGLAVYFRNLHLVYRERARERALA